MITPPDFLAQARELVAKTNAKEVDHRSAISRAYYSLFHDAFDFLANKYKSKLVDEIKNTLFSRGIPYDSNKIQSLDRKYLSENNVNLHKIIADTLFSLRSSAAKATANDFKSSRKKRNEADYDIINNYDTTKTLTELDEIQRIITTIRGL